MAEMFPESGRSRMRTGRLNVRMTGLATVCRWPNPEVQSSGELGSASLVDGENSAPQPHLRFDDFPRNLPSTAAGHEALDNLGQARL